MKNRRPITSFLFIDSLLSDEKKEQSDFITCAEHLVNMIEKGSREACPSLLTLIFKKEIQNNSNIADKEILLIITKLNKISTKNPFAVYTLGRIYTGIKVDSDHISPNINMTNLIEREKLAFQLLEKAAKLHHEEARVFLSDALATGDAGCIRPNTQKWLDLTKFLANANNQASALDYGLFRSGTLTNGTSICEAKYIKINIPQDHIEAMQYFLKSTTGPNLTIASNGLQGIYRLLKNSNSPWFNKNNEVLKLLNQEAKNNNSFLAVCMAYYYCPRELRPEIPKALQSLLILQDMIPHEECDIGISASFIIIASLSQNKRIRNLTEILTENIAEKTQSPQFHRSTYKK